MVLSLLQVFFIIPLIFEITLGVGGAHANELRNEDKPVIGWYVNHDLKHWETVDKSGITHLFFSDRHVQFENCDIGLRYLDDVSGPIESYALPILRRYAEQYNFKIILMLGGWGGSNFFGHCAHDKYRETFVTNIVNYLDKYDFDGVDLDWEHPGVGGACDFDNVFVGPKDGCWMTAAQINNSLNQGWKYHHKEDFTNFLALIKELRVRFDLLGPAKNRSMEITSAMSIGGQNEGCGGRIDGGRVYQNDPDQFRIVPCDWPDWGQICEYLDYLNVMVYDVWGNWYEYTGHHAPFDCDPDEPLMQILSPPFDKPCEPRFTVKNALRWWQNPTAPGHVFNGGCPSKKLLIGMPLYGKSLCGVPNINNGLYQKGRACDTSPDGADYKLRTVDSPTVKQIMSHGYYLNTPQYFHTALNKDGDVVGTYYYNNETLHFVSWDSPEMIYTKVKYAAEQNIGGYFFWNAEMDYEHYAADKAYNGWIDGKPYQNDGIGLCSNFWERKEFIYMTITMTIWTACNLFAVY